MKQFLLLSTALFSLVFFANAQNWVNGGNNLSSTGKLGTTSNQPLSFITNKVERGRFTSGGNFGIGTTSPITKLHVNGFGSFGNRVTTANAIRAINLADDNAVLRVLRVDASKAPAVELISRKSADGSDVAYWDFYAQPSDASFRIRDRKSGGAGLDRVTISGSGNVGIGTTSPSYKLHVENKGTAVYGNSTSGGFGVYGNSTYLGVYGVGADYGVYGYTGSNSSGTGVFGSGNYGVYGSGGTYGLYGTSSDGYGIYGTSSSSTAIYGSGYFGIYGRGTNTGTYGTGSSYGVQGFSSSGIGLYGYSSSYRGVYGQSYSNIGGYFYSTSSHGLWAQTASSESGIYAGVFQGNVYTYNSYITSDKNLKKNIQEFGDAMGIINKLRPKNYEFRSDGKYASLQLPKGNHYGLLAQDLEQLLPNLVQEAPLMINNNGNNDIKKQAMNPAPNGATAGAAGAQTANQSPNAPEIINTKAVNYTELIPIVIKGMQELSKENEELRNEVNSLKILVQTLTKQEAYNPITSSAAYLKQNTPNPSNNNTIISYYTPDNTIKAQILVTDMKGSVLKAYNASRGEGQVTISNSELPAGTYNYTLFVNSTKIDTKKMIIIK